MAVRYIPNQGDVRRRMLERIGAAEVSDLFRCVPEDLKVRGTLDVPGPLSEAEVRRELDALGTRARTPGLHASFLGAGAYRHFLPAAVDHLISRSEFYSSYTPYQPEISQGTLQAVFEYQTMVCALTSMEVANASMYDGSTALAEAVLLAHRAGKGRKVLLSRAVHPEYREVVRTYLRAFPVEIVEVPFGEDGRTDLDALRKALDGDTLCVALQSPNFFGCVEGLRAVREALDSASSKALFLVAVTEPYSLGLLVPPGEAGADVCCGEMQAFGSTPSYGGPCLGFFAARQALVRAMPGRLAGATVDVEGNPAYVLTLSTREQHIRREKATSNICTNEGLVALAAAIHMSLLGRDGLREAAERCLDAAAFTLERVLTVAGFSRRFAAPFFNEVVVRSAKDVDRLLWDLMERHVLAGVPLGRWYPELRDSFLVTATELTTREDVERLRTALQEVSR